MKHRWYTFTGSNTNLQAAIAGYWKRIGVNSETLVMDGPQLLSQYVPKLQPSFAGNSIMVMAPGILGFDRVPNVYHSVKGSHKNIKNPALDALLDKILVTTDQAEVTRMQREATILIRNEYSAPGVVDLQTVVALGKNVGDWKPTPGLPRYAYDLVSVTPAK